MGRKVTQGENFEPDVQEVELKDNGEGIQENTEVAEVVEQAEVAEPIKVEAKKESKPTLNTKVPTVKVRAMEDIDATIGGKLYNIRKDREASVPTDVACVLVNSKLAYRL